MDRPTYREELIRIIGDDQALMEVIGHEIRDGKISDQTYARIFSLLFFTRLDGAECINYSKASTQWRRGKKPISDVKLFGLMAQVCDAIRYSILDSWQGCLVSALTSDKVVQQIESELDCMESMGHVQSILHLASEMMVFTNTNGQFSWDAPEDTGEEDA